MTAAGLQILADGPEGPGVEDGFTFEDAEGFAFQIYSRMQQVELPDESLIRSALADSVTSTSSRSDAPPDAEDADRGAGFPDL